MFWLLASRTMRSRKGQPNTNSRIGPEIDGDEIVAGGGGIADAAEERPGGAVDRQRQGIDERPAAARLAEAAGPVGVPREREQDTHVSQRQRHNAPAFDHGPFDHACTRSSVGGPGSDGIGRAPNPRTEGRRPEASHSAGSRPACPTVARLTPAGAAGRRGRGAADGSRSSPRARLRRAGSPCRSPGRRSSWRGAPCRGRRSPAA